MCDNDYANYFLGVNGKCEKSREEFYVDIEELKDIKINKTPNPGTERLLKLYQERLIPKIKYRLDRGHNVILCGLGSKKVLIEYFRKKYLESEQFVVIDGYMSDISLRQIQNTLKELFLDQKDLEKDLINKISSFHSHFYLLVNSIDKLYSNLKIKAFLNKVLSASPKTHLLATVDHINSAAIFSLPEYIQLNLSWINCPTLQEYKSERTHAKTLLSRNLGFSKSKNNTCSLAAITSVFENLPISTKKIFLKILSFYNDQPSRKTAKPKAKERPDSDSDEDSDTMEVDEPDCPHYTFRDLFSDCINEFLVHSETILNSQLTEFIDHHWISKNRTKDGELYIELKLHKKMIGKVLAELTELVD